MQHSLTLSRPQVAGKFSPRVVTPHAPRTLPLPAASADQMLDNEHAHLGYVSTSLVSGRGGGGGEVDGGGAELFFISRGGGA